MSVLVYVALAVAAVITLTIDWLTEEGVRPDNDPVGSGKLIDPAVLSEQDHRIAQQTGEAIRQCFGGQLSEQIPQMSAQQRVDATKQLIDQLAALYHISITAVNLVKMPQNECGSYNPQTGVITLNSIYLMTNNIDCIREFLDTIVHELRHAIQISILSGNDFWETSPEVMESWLHNLVPRSHYISPKRNIKRYAMQPVERDATVFAYYSLKEVQ